LEVAAIPAIQARYGRRAGWLRHHVARTLDRLGAYAPLRRVRWDEVERLVFVCHGNICRSAYADVRARGAGLRTASFGLCARDGDPANRVALERAADRGVDLSGHRARSAAATGLGRGDLLVAMEPAQLRELARVAPAHPATLLGLWARPPRPHLEDPYGLSPTYFDTCFDVVDSAVQELARRATRARVGRGAGVTP
jgi:protein-tyrosine phosphatase